MPTKTNAKIRPHERLAHALRECVRTGFWRNGQMIPGRHALAREHGVALSTVERAVSTLISEGMLRADDRRGTFVTASPDERPEATWKPPAGATRREPVVATVGIVAAVVPYDRGSLYESQWPVQVLHGCEHRLAAEPGVTVRFLNTVTPGQADLPVAIAVDRLLGEGADAVILIGQEPSAEELDRLEAVRMPVALATYDPLPLAVPQVYIDSAVGGALAARHLLERGYERLVYFQPFTAVWTEQRLAGVKACLAGLRRPPRLLRVIPGDPSHSLSLAGDQQAMARQRALAVLRAGWQPGTGVIAPNDSVARGFMEAAEACGLSAGCDFGIVGFDDQARDVGLTSLRPPLAALGEEVARLTIRLLHGEDAPSRVALQHRLIARTSTRPRGAEM